MTRLREKLTSQREASILLALLLFLVCCMVAASVMVAAVSNVGKTRSSSVEQQKYLTLSSAIQLIADELEGAEYQGKYDIYEWYKTITTVDDSDLENPIETSYEIYLIAELVVKTDTLPTLDYSPTGRTPEDPSVDTPKAPSPIVPTTKWELSSIKKGVS